MNRSESEPVRAETARSRSGREDAGGAAAHGGAPRRHYGRYLGVLAVAILAAVAINSELRGSEEVAGIAPGHTVPPFAVPLARGTLTGAADVATHANDGAAGRVPACAERGAQILNMCELYERGPVVLALFIDAGSCPQVLDQMQALAARFPQVGFAAVALKGERGPLLALMRAHGLTRVQVGFDEEGTLAGLYKLATCPQVSFVLPGGVVQSPALLSTPSQATLRARVAALVAASRARESRTHVPTAGVAGARESRTQASTAGVAHVRESQARDRASERPGAGLS